MCKGTSEAQSLSKRGRSMGRRHMPLSTEPVWSSNLRLNHCATSEGRAKRVLVMREIKRACMVDVTYMYKCIVALHFGYYNCRCTLPAMPC